MAAIMFILIVMTNTDPTPGECPRTKGYPGLQCENWSTSEIKTYKTYGLSWEECEEAVAAQAWDEYTSAYCVPQGCG